MYNIINNYDLFIFNLVNTLININFEKKSVLFV